MKKSLLWVFCSAMVLACIGCDPGYIQVPTVDEVNPVAGITIIYKDKNNVEQIKAIDSSATADLLVIIPKGTNYIIWFTGKDDGGIRSIKGEHYQLTAGNPPTTTQLPALTGDWPATQALVSRLLTLNVPAHDNAEVHYFIGVNDYHDHFAGTKQLIINQANQAQ